jgi:hypothetical protein
MHAVVGDTSPGKAEVAENYYTGNPIHPPHYSGQEKVQKHP